MKLASLEDDCPSLRLYADTVVPVTLSCSFSIYYWLHTTTYTYMCDLWLCGIVPNTVDAYLEASLIMIDRYLLQKRASHISTTPCYRYTYIHVTNSLPITLYIKASARWLGYLLCLPKWRDLDRVTCLIEVLGHVTTRRTYVETNTWLPEFTAVATLPIWQCQHQE